MSDTKISEAAPVAWVHEEDSDRVISATQKATAIRDGGASATSVKAYSVAAYIHPQPADLADQQGGGSLNTSEGGRRYVADFFARELRRHDFTRYITTTLAADFACALAQHLAATGKQQVGEECLTCSDRGWVGGPTFSDPAEGGMQCPDCNALDAHMERYEQRVGEVVTDRMVEAALQSTVAEPNVGTPWREVVALDDHADFIADMRKAIKAAISVQPGTPGFSPATQAVADHCDRIFWRHNYYTLPLGPSDRAKPTRRRQSAVELVQKLGFQWKNEAWVQVGEVQWSND